MSTVDRRYGFIEPIHHNIGTHTIHHLFPQIPHYNLLVANKAFQEAKLTFTDEHVKHRASAAPILPAFLTGWRRYLKNQIVGPEVQTKIMED